MVLAALTLMIASSFCASEPPPGQPPTNLADEMQRLQVRSLPREVLRARPASPRERALMDGYYDSIQQWGKVLATRFQQVPGHPEWGYYGRGGHAEDDVRPITYAAMVNAFLSEVSRPEDARDETERERLRGEAVAALRYLTQAHVTGGGACLDGKPWGNQWQSAMWARAAGMAGWFLWLELDEELSQSIARLVEFEADRFLSTQPKSSEFGDTGAEENAWNSTLLALAANMMADHPRAAKWDEAARRFLYNSLSVAADRTDESPGDFARPIRQWVTTVNAHPDFTVENHGLVHVGYLKTTAAMLMESASPYALAETPVPEACFHHVDRAFDVLLACSAWDGSPVYFGGNDWKIFHSQATDIVIYAGMSVLARDRHAAWLEETALDWLRRMQQAEGGYYNVRRDIEYGGLCATRLIACYWTHAVSGEAASPVTREEFDRRCTGVRYLPYAKALLHRTPTKFASFSWGPKRMALAMPADGNWVVWPHFASYLGLVNGKDSSERYARLTKLEHVIGDDRFFVTGSLRRVDGHVTQDFSFTSLPGDVTVYVERLTSEKGYPITSRLTGVIGADYDLGTNERILQGAFGSRQLVGVGGETQTIEWFTDWLNVGDRVGYVVRRIQGRENVFRYFDQTQGTGRVPQLQEWFSLIGDREQATPADQGDWACIVTFLNQPAAETKAWADRVEFNADGDHAACRIAKDTIRVDFDSMKTAIEHVVGK